MNFENVKTFFSGFLFGAIAFIAPIAVYIAKTGGL